MAYSQPPSPFVVDPRFPGKVYCDDDAGTIVADCTFTPDIRLYRYDGVAMATRIAECLNACDGIEVPVSAIDAVRSVLLLNLGSWEALRNAGQIVEPHPCISATCAALELLTPPVK